MKRIVIIVMTLVGCLIHPNIVEAQKVKDAFVLVDVSGSMKYTQINSEAKQIICSMLQGNLNLSNFPGWSQVKTKGLEGNCPLISDKNSSFVSAGGKVCILPFGNMERVRDYKFIDMSNFETSFNSYFPNTFRDNWTYITLAKAYAVNVASKNGISGMVYMIIYSDGAEESMDGQVGYPEEFRSVVDYFGTRNDSFCQKKGIIRKSYNGKQFDIEIWTMGPIPMVEEPYIPSTKVESKKIEISNQPNGKSPKVPVEINVEEPFTVKWKNATGTTKINVQIKKGKTYTNIPTSEKDGYYTIDKKASSGTITFYEPQDYKVIVADENSRDERYVKAKGNVLKDVFPVIIIVILIIGGVLLWKLLSQPRPKPGWGNRNGNAGNNSNNNDDWN
ncbi:MAG: hypothetical protein IJ998_06945 [Alistipes sp.]|nr:hypothetical protein [Alistipes sp.]